MTSKLSINFECSITFKCLNYLYFIASINDNNSKLWNKGVIMSHVRVKCEYWRILCIRISFLFLWITVGNRLCTLLYGRKCFFPLFFNDIFCGQNVHLTEFSEVGNCPCLCPLPLLYRPWSNPSVMHLLVKFTSIFLLHSVHNKLQTSKMSTSLPSPQIHLFLQTSTDWNPNVS